MNKLPVPYPLGDLMDMSFKTMNMMMKHMSEVMHLPQPGSMHYESATITDDDNTYTLRLMLFGVCPETLVLDFVEHTLTVHAETRTGEHYKRAFHFTTPVKEHAITAQYESNILIVTLPKAWKGTGYRRIHITVPSREHG